MLPSSGGSHVAEDDEVDQADMYGPDETDAAADWQEKEYWNRGEL